MRPESHDQERGHRNEYGGHTRRKDRRKHGSGLIFGIILLTAGALFLLDNLDVVEVEGFFHWWPLILVAIGLGELLEGRQLGATIWIGVGAWFLGWNFGFIVVNPFEIFWPALLATVGGIFVWQSVSRGETESRHSMNAFALMAGNVQSVSSEVVDVIQATAIMGGCEIDLRKMKSGDGETVVELFTLWGGIEIKVPEGWAVESKATPLLGAVENQTAPPAPDAPRIVLRGMIVMGGVEVGN